MCCDMLPKGYNHVPKSAERIFNTRKVTHTQAITREHETAYSTYHPTQL
jgi:hypothetical protein